MATRTDTIVGFLTGVGIPVEFGPVTVATAMPGITIADGGILLDSDAAYYAGDLLHEAGHLALLPPSLRASVSGILDAEIGAGYEVGAICWSVAAARHLGFELEIIFHGDGYRGDSDWFTETYGSGAAPGLPLLHWAGLTWAPGPEPDGEEPFPKMRQWVRTNEIELS